MSDPLKAIGGGSDLSEVYKQMQLQKTDQVGGVQQQEQGGAAKVAEKPQEGAQVDTKDKVSVSDEAKGIDKAGAAGDVKGADKVGSANEVKSADKVNKAEETKETEKPNESKFEELKAQIQKLTELQPGQQVGQAEEASKTQGAQGAAEAQKI